MAPKLLSRIVIFTFILSLCFTIIPAPVLAASGSKNQNQNQTEIKQHTFKIYLDPTLVPNMDFAKAVLPKYVKDMNVILAKNTNRQLVFNPETDLVLTNNQPYSDQAAIPLPVENFEIWAYAIQSTYRFSYGGYAGVDMSGAGVLAGLKWAKLYDPDELNPGELTDYWTQINNMLHELAHVFGAGIGEYYKLSSIQDATDVSPFLNINVLDPNDSFWKDKPDFMADPLLRNAVQISSLAWTSREDLLAFVKYSDLTATIISNDYRNAAPTVDLQHITLSVVSDNGVPIDAANIKIWSVIGASPFQTHLVVDTNTDSNGQASFSWGGSLNPHNNYDFLRLIKVYKDGYVASARYVSIFDADIVKLVDGSDLLNVKISLVIADVPPILSEGDSTNVAMSENGSPKPFTLTLDATDGDNDNITWSILSQAGHGTASVSGTGPSKAISYAPALHYYGSDSFVVQVLDGRGGTDMINVNVTVTAIEPASFTLFLPFIQR